MTAEILCLAGLVTGLAVIVFEDLRDMRIPDLASLPLIAGGLVCAFLHRDPTAAAAGAAVGYLLMIAVEFLYRGVRGRDGLGRGDAKLLAAAGAWVGWAGLPMVLLIGAGTALVAAVAAGRRDRPMPFGPFLALGLLAVYFGTGN